MRIKPIAEQRQVTPSRTVIQKTYQHGEDYETVTESWVPKVSWFHPPCIKIFRWAYFIEVNISHTVKNREPRHISGPATYVNEDGRITQIGVLINEGGKDKC